MTVLPTTITPGDPGHIGHHVRLHGLTNPVQLPFVIAPIASGLEGNRPAAALAGRLYGGTDTGRLFWDDATEWNVTSRLFVGTFANRAAVVTSPFDGDIYFAQDIKRAYWWSLLTAAWVPFDADSVYDVMDYGAVGNGSTDDTAAIQAAITACGVGGGGVVFVPKDHRTTSPLVMTNDNVRIIGRSRNASFIRNSASDIFLLGTPGQFLNHVEFHDIRLISEASGGGHIFKCLGGVYGSTWSRIKLNQFNAAKHYVLWNSPVDGYIDNLWEDFDAEHVPTATVPGFKFVTSGTLINSNTWQRFRASYSGDYVFHIECTGLQQWNENNVWRDATWEYTNGGCIRLMTCRGGEIVDTSTNDLTVVSATINKSIYYFGSSTGSTEAARHIAVRNYHRAGGTFAAGKTDIEIEANSFTTSFILIENCSGVGGPQLSIECHGQNVQTLNIPDSAAITNPGGSSILGDEFATRWGGYPGVRIQGNRALGGPFIDVPELSATPPAPAADTFRLYSGANGSGKTQVLVRWQSGTTTVLATEP